MAVRGNPTVIGGFVLGGIALLVVALFLFGAGNIFRQRPLAVAYFDNSVTGLYVGAPVTFRGVPIGSVKSISLEVDVHTLAAKIPVVMELDPERIKKIGGKAVDMSEAIQNGLRAQLVSQSIVTGQAMIDLDFFPGTPLNLVGAPKGMVEIPTVPSPLEKVKRTLESLPIQQLADNASRVLDSLQKLLTSPEATQALAGTAQGTKAFAQLMEELRGQVKPTAENLDKTLESIDRSITALRGDLGTTSAQANATLRTTQQALLAAQAALKQAQATLASVNGMLSPNSMQRANINLMLRNLADASRSLRELAAELERNPNSIILGRSRR
ncbi:MAG: MlaD family protein [Magnetospirillum sp.]|nr:MlaD family protein [Magnetospirillum sp.]